MTLDLQLCFAAATVAVLLGLAAVFRKRAVVASWTFCLGLWALAAESVFSGLSLRAGEPESGSVRWLEAALIAKALVPGFWLWFSLTFSRGNAGEFVRRWRVVLVAAFVLPVAVVVAYPGALMEIVQPEASPVLVARNGSGAKFLGLLGLVTAVLVLMNLERTYRAAVGTTRWRVKFMVLGAGVLFGTRIYTRSQTLLFSTYNPAMPVVDAGALLIGCLLMTVGYTRRGLAGLDVYPSREVLQKSVTIVVVGGYLFVVGVLAEFVSFLGGAGSFPAQAFIVLLGIAGLAVLLLSDRFRIGLQRFVTRNFQRPEHDFRKVWARFSREFSGVVGAAPLCAAASRLIAETFDVLSTTILLVDRHREQLVLASSTSRTGETEAATELDVETSAQASDALRGFAHPFDPADSGAPWAEAIVAMTPIQFAHGGNRLAARLMVGDQVLGLVVLADRVNGMPYTQEERDLLECIADELAARLLNQNLGEEVMQAREMEAFQAMSAFFVHDLKNAANSLNLTLKNLPKHFDNPEFRDDALRGIAKTSARIGQLTDRLGTLRQNLEPTLAESDLNALVEAALGDVGGPSPAPGAAPPAAYELATDLHPLPPVRVDRDQIRSVVTNLILNAREALGPGGRITVTTRHDGSRVRLTVEDNGCGMSADFIRNSLFRPFHSTKKQGLGIGMFQARMIIEAHQGTLHVESTPGKGTVFRISLGGAARGQ